MIYVTIGQAEVWDAMARRFATLNTTLPTDAYFVDDDDLRYRSGDDDVTVGRDALIPSEETRNWFQYFLPGASWVHCNLLRTRDGLTVVSLRRGGRAREPTDTFSINASVERRPLVIVEQ